MLGLIQHLVAHVLQFAQGIGGVVDGVTATFQLDAALFQRGQQACFVGRVCVGLLDQVGSGDTLVKVQGEVAHRLLAPFVFR